MNRSFGAVSLMMLLIGSCAMGQNTAQFARLRLFLPPNVSSEKVEIRYVLYGAFGANGNFINPKPDSSAAEIPLGIDGKPAEEIKGFAWAPGCRIATFDIKLEGVDVQQTYACEPSPVFVLTGRIQKSELVRSQETEINVDYLAGWACEFFGFADCMVPQFSVARTSVDAERRFEIELPDLASDPTCVGSGLPSTFRVALREVKSMNQMAFLTPKSKALQAPGGGLKLASSYPHPTIFLASKPK